MANFVLMYFNGEDPAAADHKPTEEEMEGIKKAWMGWFEELGDSLVDGGNPFNYNGMYIEPDNVSEIGGNWPATGYSIIKADSMEDAVKLAQGNPGLKGSEGFSIRVFEAMPM